MKKKEVLGWRFEKRRRRIEGGDGDGVEGEGHKSERT